MRLHEWRVSTHVRDAARKNTVSFHPGIWIYRLIIIFLPHSLDFCSNLWEGDDTDLHIPRVASSLKKS